MGVGVGTEQGGREGWAASLASTRVTQAGKIDWGVDGYESTCAGLRSSGAWELQMESYSSRKNSEGGREWSRYPRKNCAPRGARNQEAWRAGEGAAAIVGPQPPPCSLKCF